MPTVFVSYRRDDTGGHAGRIADALRERFGTDYVFMDVESIPAGRDYVDTLNREILQARVLLVVIGRNWLLASNDRGQRRLDEPGDFVCLEIAWALRQGLDVIPVLVQGVTMPRMNVLPAPIWDLTKRQAVEIRDSRWRADISDLARTLERYATPPPKSASQSESTFITRLLLLLPHAFRVAYIGSIAIAIVSCLLLGMAMANLARQHPWNTQAFNVFTYVLFSAIIAVPNCVLLARTRPAGLTLALSPLFGVVFADPLNAAWNSVDAWPLDVAATLVIVAVSWLAFFYLLGIGRVLLWIWRRF